MKGDILHITLKPEDFDFNNTTEEGNLNEWGNDTETCPLGKAMIRDGFYDTHIVIKSCYAVKYGVKMCFEIKSSFNFDDFLYVKEQYRKDPEMKKCEYYVTLIEQ